MKEYIKYQHVEKIGSTEVEGIEIGTCYIFPKIDGTNAHIWAENGEIKAGSRNRELSIESDNAGFYAWVQENMEQLKKLFDILFDGTHIYGEWLVPHSLKTYRDNAWRRFYIFDIVKPDGGYFTYEEIQHVCEQAGYDDYITPIRIIKNPTIDNITKCLDENTFLMKDGNVGEGVVVKNYEFVNKFGRQTWAKIVTSDFKEKHSREMGAPVSSGTSYVEEKVVAKYITSAFVDKVYANIINESDGWRSQYIPRLLNTVYYDLVREHTWDFVKENKNPKIDFKILLKFTTLKIKELKPEIF